MTYRFHLLGIPHTASSPRYLSCAYTQKVVKLCAMLKARGHHVTHYGGEGSQVICDEHVDVTSKADLATYGEQAGMGELYKFAVTDPCYQKFFANSIAEIAKRKQARDFLLCMWGAGHKPVADAHADMIVVEPGIGYASGYFAKWKVFESKWLLAAYHGLHMVGTADLNGAWYDVVIPNYFDVNDFTYRSKKSDYILFLGRLGQAKGLHIAIEVAKAAGVRLVIAGTGQSDVPIPVDDPLVDFVGFADVAKRRHLLSHAKALIAPSMFAEPFCGVQVEAMLSGTPVISTDWGAFTEINRPNETGYRCRTFEHFVWAVKNVDRIKPRVCRTRALDFSMERVSPIYEEYWQMVMDVHTGKGWYQPRPERSELHCID